MSVDLLITGKHGILNSQKLLNTTSNNINNTNTEGYIRKETVTYTSCVNWGVGSTVTRRLYDQYVQRQMFTETGTFQHSLAIADGLDNADTILSDETTSLDTAVTSFLDKLSTAVSSPTSAASRSEAKGQLENLVSRITTANESMVDSLNSVNQKITDEVNSVNELTKSIAEFNGKIRSLRLSNEATNNEIYMQMLDERDRLVGELAEHVGLNVQTENDYTYNVYMDNGILLCNGDSYAQFNDGQSQFDVTKKEITVSYQSVSGGHLDKTSLKLQNKSIGGALGGYLESTTDIRNAMRNVGKMTVALADALNVQNKAGFTLEDKAGDNILTIADTYAVSTDNNNSMLCHFVENEGTKVLGNDFQVSFADGALHVYKVNEGEQLEEITASIDAADITTAGGVSSIHLKDYGIELSFNKTIAQLEADKTTFYVQPTMLIGSNVKSNISKPEDFAFASAVRTDTGSNNYGNAVISLSSCTNTGADYGVSVNATTLKPEFNTGAPTQIITDAGGNYCIYDSANNLLGRAPASCNGNNVFANALTYDAATDTYTTAFDRGTGYPGYDVNVSGTVKENDKFYININSGGQADNNNGNALIAIRSKNIVRTSEAGRCTTFNEGYGDMLGSLGTKVSTATTEATAAKAKLDSTISLYESSAGVNLDEEATNLLRYQQTYQACSKIIEASQTIFNSLISAI